MGSTFGAEGAGECAAVEKLRMGAKGGGGGKSIAFEGWTIGTVGSGENASIVHSRMGVQNADKRSAVEGEGTTLLDICINLILKTKLFNASSLCCL